MPVKMDEYSSKIGSYNVMSAANTLTFESIDFGISVFQKIAIKMNRIEILPTIGSLGELVANTDAFFWALTNSNSLTSITLDDDPRIYQSGAIVLPGANVTPFYRPLVYDFSTFPNGGLIIPPRPLYWGLFTSGFAAAGAAYFRLWFQMIELKDAEYLELVQSVVGTAL